MIIQGTMNSHSIDPSNTINGKPVYYWKFINDAQVPSDAGQVILVNCKRIRMENLELTNTCAGVQLGYSEENIISENNITENYYGLNLHFSNQNNITENNISTNFEGCYLYGSEANSITKNTMLNNNNALPLISSPENRIICNNVSDNKYGISLYFSLSNSNLISENKVLNNYYGFFIHETRDNYIYHNNIINNTWQVFKDYDSEFWDMDYPIGGNFWSDYVGEDLYKGPNQDQPGSDGIGDSPYVINSINQDNYPLIEPYTYRALENYTILHQGWNLISIPLIQENQNLQKVLEMIDGWYDAVQWHDPSGLGAPWKHYKVGKPFGNNLFELNETMGFWIHIIHPRDTIFLYNGTQPSENQTIVLYKGWNLVGYLSLSNYNRTMGLNNLEFNNDIDCIQYYNASSRTWHFMDSEDNFIIGCGYWIHAKTDCVWEVPL
jgi:parallel beta-helix repeat protein